MKKALQLLAGALVLAIIGTFVYPRLENKFIDVNYRIRLLETRADSFGKYIVKPIEYYQEQRGDAKIEISGGGILDSESSWKEIETPWQKNIS